jgi:hypothetical protein
MIQEKDKLLQLGVISITDTSNKSLVAQNKYKSKNPRKKHPQQKNKKKKGPKPCTTSFAPNGNKGKKYKK